MLWILQWGIGLFFIGVGVIHFVLPDGLPEFMSWMYDMSDTLHYVSGTAEILGGLGLILPWLTGIARPLTPIAAGGLAFIMVGAIIWHAGRGEALQIANNVFLLAMMGYVAYARWNDLRGPTSPGIDQAGEERRRIGGDYGEKS